MRIDRLMIHDFKNLRDFSIDFDETSLTTVLVGANGSGKSNLLEALVLIFRSLDLGEPPPFAYSLRYICRDRTIEVDTDPGRKRNPTKVNVDGTPIAYSRFAKSAERESLPSNVFGYYSGPGDRLERHFERHHESFRRNLIRPGSEEKDLPLRPLFYARPVHSQFVLLSFFVEQNESVHQFLEDYLNIVALESVRFVIKKPHWAGKRASRDRFWGARGVPRSFLDRLFEISLAPLDRAPEDEQLNLYLPNLASLKELYDEYGNQRDFFKTLESTYISDLLDSIHIQVRVKGSDEPLTFAELSEGEQQLLTVIGLLRFTHEAESLFLLDEPDTHLNPLWSYEYLGLLHDVVGTATNSHIIIATHDPLMIGGLQKSQVQVLRRDPETGQVEAHQPDQDPRGMGVSALLTSELFGLRSTLDAETQQDLDRKRELATKEDLTDDEHRELDSLNDSLANLDFTTTMRDPLFNLFVDAMVASGQYQELKKPSLTPEQRDRQMQLARRIVEDITESETE